MLGEREAPHFRLLFASASCREQKRNYSQRLRQAGGHHCATPYCTWLAFRKGGLGRTTRRLTLVKQDLLDDVSRVRRSQPVTGPSATPETSEHSLLRRKMCTTRARNQSCSARGRGITSSPRRATRRGRK